MWGLYTISFLVAERGGKKKPRLCRMRLLGAWWLIGRKILKMTKFVWMCVLGSGAHLKVCGHALLVAPLVPGPGRPFDYEFSTLGCRGRSVARSPVAEGRVRKVWQNTILAAAAPDMPAHSNLFAPPASYIHGLKGDHHCAAEATAGSSHAPPPR